MMWPATAAYLFWGVWLRAWWPAHAWWPAR